MIIDFRNLTYALTSIEDKYDGTAPAVAAWAASLLDRCNKSPQSVKLSELLLAEKIIGRHSDPYMTPESAHDLIARNK